MTVGGTNCEDTHPAGKTWEGHHCVSFHSILESATSPPGESFLPSGGPAHPPSKASLSVPARGDSLPCSTASFKATACNPETIGITQRVRRRSPKTRPISFPRTPPSSSLIRGSRIIPRLPVRANSVGTYGSPWRPAGRDGNGDAVRSRRKQGRVSSTVSGSCHAKNSESRTWGLCLSRAEPIRLQDRYVPQGVRLRGVRACHG